MPQSISLLHELIYCSQQLKFHTICLAGNIKSAHCTNYVVHSSHRIRLIKRGTWYRREQLPHNAASTCHSSMPYYKQVQLIADI